MQRCSFQLILSIKWNFVRGGGGGGRRFLCTYSLPTTVL
jgi:hypothetical protein